MTWRQRILTCLCLCTAASTAPADEPSSARFRVPAVSISGGGAVNMRSESGADMFRQVDATIGQPAPVGSLRDSAGELVCVGGFWASESGASPASACLGDCGGDGNVTVDELVQGVNIALGNAPTDDCPVFDANVDHAVTVDELVQAVSNALNGCREQ